MKRTLSFGRGSLALVVAGTGLIAATYGLVRLAYGLFLPDVRAELAMGAEAAGLISSGASLAYCAGALVSLVLAAWPRGLVVAATATAAGGALGMALAPGVPAFAVFAVISSAGAGFASPALVAIIGGNVPPAENDRAQAVVNSGTGPGLVGAGLLALALLPSWRLAWAVAAAFTLAVAAAVLLLDRDRTSRPARGFAVPPPRWFGAHAVVIASALLLGAGSAAVWTYGRTLLVDAGMGERSTVAAWIALGLGGAAVAATSRWTSALPPTTAWALTTSAVALATSAAGALPSHVGAAMVACAVFGWGFVAATGALIAVTTRIDEPRAAAGTSLLFVMLVLGQAVGATLLGLVIEARGGPTAFLGAAVVTVVAALLPLGGAEASGWSGGARARTARGRAAADAAASCRADA